jgi:hypothetical protein
MSEICEFVEIFIAKEEDALTSWNRGGRVRYHGGVISTEG